MKLSRRDVISAASAAAILSSAKEARAQDSDAGDVVHAAKKAIEEQYVDPVAAAGLGRLLEKNYIAGRYGRLSSSALAAQMTRDLQDASHDLHLAVNFEPPAPTGQAAAALPEDALHPRTTNYGVQTVARLQGNIGLLRITHFPSPPFRFDNRYGAAMELLRDTDALILDLRDNHGGGTDTLGFFLSYFFKDQIEFGRIHSRSDPDEIIAMTHEITGPSYGEDRPIHVLISRNTFSAGEAVAYHMKQHKRATLVGERTKGGAHPGSFVKLPHDFTIFIPMGRSDGPDWEGTGVLPDIAAPPADALSTAHRILLQRLLAAAPPGERREILQNVIANRIENLSSFAL